MFHKPAVRQRLLSAFDFGNQIDRLDDKGLVKVREAHDDKGDGLLLDHVGEMAQLVRVDQL